MSSPSERVIQPGWEHLVPRTSDDFAKKWKESPERQALIREIDQYNHDHPFAAADLDLFSSARTAEKSKKQRKSSPYTLSYWNQIRLCLWREWQQLKNEPWVTLIMLASNFFEALIVSSVLYNLAEDTSAFFSRGALLFMMVLLSAFSSVLEIIALYEKRAIVEKHTRYALYHPSADAISSIIMSMPYKVVNLLFTNLVLYFMGNLRREAGPFFFLYLVSFAMMMSMSLFFRFIASVTKTVAQAFAPASIILNALILYTGFAIPVTYMRGWASWMRWINPVFYGFEAVMLNEFHGRQFPCASYVPSGPGYENVSVLEKTCSAVGAVPGSDVVQGTDFIRSLYGFENANRWRNFGIILALTIFLAFCHLVTSELVTSSRSKGEVLVFRRGVVAQKAHAKRQQPDEEKGAASAAMLREKTSTDAPAQVTGMEQQSSIFHWEKVTYDIKIKGEPRRILDHVDGWIRPGTLTALMVSNLTLEKARCVGS
jgi:ABC-type multidrug transport system permease subunit